MRHDKLERELEMLLMLTDNRGYSMEKVCERLSISRRNFYYYLEFFRDYGFMVGKENGIYRIDRNSPFFKRLVERITFTEEEAIIIQRLLNKTDKKNALIENMKEKLNRFYDFSIIKNNKANEQSAHVISQLYDAIKYKQVVVLCDYTSPHGRTKRDRLVEPFLLMNDNNEVRCYEPASKMNKTFKIARINDVKILTEQWKNEDKHRQMYTDVFMFSGEEQMPVKLRLGTLACQMMKEEYPRTAKWMTRDEQNHWLIEMNVCSYAGIGRFVLGLYDDIEILGDEAFIQYISKKIEEMYNRTRTADISQT